MDSNEDLRNKRLNFYSKFMSTSISQIDNENLNFAQHKPPLHSSSIDLSKKVKTTTMIDMTRNSQTPSSSIANKNEVLNKIFGDYETQPKRSLKFNQSLSFDESSTCSFGEMGGAPLSASSTASSRRFEEFKRVVESSYEQHVLNKMNDLNLSLSPVKTTMINSSTSGSNNRAPPPPPLPLPPLEIASARQQIGSANSVMKIPYMSAYNIYDEDSSARVNVNLEVTTPAPKNTKATLGSNGSSLTTSPTSMSSGETNIQHQTGNGMINDRGGSSSATITAHRTATAAELTIKPPLTPKPKAGELTFRKNLLRRSSASTTPVVSKPISSSLFADSLEIQKRSKDLEIEIEQTEEPAIITTNNIFKPTQSNTHEAPNSPSSSSSSDSGSDTFDIFSSRESLKNDDYNNVSKPKKPPTVHHQAPKKMDLSIDLSGLQSDDDDVKEIKEATKREEEEEEKAKIIEKQPKENDDDNFIISSSKRNSTSSIRQVKPDNIPNLALDLFDDDRSQSVTVSLAKSMCKEIDYKKEMEAIVSKENFSNSSSSHETNTNNNGHVKNNRLKPIDLESLKVKKAKRANKPPHGPSNFNLTSSIKQEKRSTEKPGSHSYFLKPLSSSRENTSRSNIEEENIIQRPNSSSILNSKLTKTWQPISSVVEPNKPQNKNNEMIKHFTKKSVSYLKSSTKDFENRGVGENNYIWKSSIGGIKKRPSSAQSLKEIRKTTTTTTEERKPAPLFLDYSKLIAIEASLEHDNKHDDNNHRPMTSLANYKSLNVNTDMDDMETTDDTIDFDVELNEEVKRQTDEEVKIEPRWLELPDEIWLKILSCLQHLDLVRMGSTCKKLNQLYSDNSLWRKITLKYKYEMRDEWLNWIGKRRPSELNIIQCSGNLTLFAISDMFRNIGEQLTSLNLSRCSNGALSGDNFALQASIRCPNVTNLDLSWTLLSNQTLKLIIDSFKKIEVINLSGCNMIQEDGFNQLLLKHGESLRSIEISGCIHFSSNCLINIGVYCRNIERLNISNCHRMTNESLMEACQHWPKLKHIDFRGIKQIKNNCVSLLVRKCPGLESIALGECVSIGDTSIYEIATYKPNIKYLDANSCKKLTDNSLRSLANFCNRLQYLNIRATNVTDIGLLSLANGKCAQHFEEINLSYLPISEPILLKLIRNCKKLKRIHLYGCFHIKNIETIRHTFIDRLNSLEICI